MLASRFHPAAVGELLDAGSYIKSDDLREGELFEQEFSKMLDWACNEPLLFRCFEDDFRKVKVGKFHWCGLDSSTRLYRTSG